METSNVRDGKFYKLPPEKENTAKKTCKKYIRIHTKHDFSFTKTTCSKFFHTHCKFVGTKRADRLLVFISVIAWRMILWKPCLNHTNTYHTWWTTQEHIWPTHFFFSFMIFMLRRILVQTSFIFFELSPVSHRSSRIPREIY